MPHLASAGQPQGNSTAALTRDWPHWDMLLGCAGCQASPCNKASECTLGSSEGMIATACRVPHPSLHHMSGPRSCTRTGRLRCSRR